MCSLDEFLLRVSPNELPKKEPIIWAELSDTAFGLNPYYRVRMVALCSALLVSNKYKEKKYFGRQLIILRYIN